MSSPISSGCVGVGEVDGVERVGLAEGDDDGEVVEPAHRLDLLVDAELVDAAGLRERRVGLAQRHDGVEVAGLVGRPERDAQRAVGVVHRPAVLDLALHGARRRRTSCRCRRGRRRRARCCRPGGPGSSSRCSRWSIARRPPAERRRARREVEPVGGEVGEVDAVVATAVAVGVDDGGVEGDDGRRAELGRPSSGSRRPRSRRPALVVDGGQPVGQRRLADELLVVLEGRALAELPVRVRGSRAAAGRCRARPGRHHRAGGPR